MTYKVNEPFHPICFACNKDTSMCVALFSSGCLRLCCKKGKKQSTYMVLQYLC